MSEGAGVPGGPPGPAPRRRPLWHRLVGWLSALLVLLAAAVPAVMPGEERAEGAAQVSRASTTAQR